nr:hypothetical protein [Mycobacterium uberis]
MLKLVDQSLIRAVLTTWPSRLKLLQWQRYGWSVFTDKAVHENEADVLLRRLGMAIRCVSCLTLRSSETLECLDGNGYVEDFGIQRLYCEAMLVGI